MKYIGLALIFSVCVYTGYDAAAQCRQKLKLTEAFISFITYIKAQIEFFSAPLSDIYAGFRGGLLDDIGFTAVLRRQGLDAALGSIRSSLPDDVYDSLESFSAGLGKSGKQSQLDLCDYHIEVLNASCSAQKTSLPQKTRLYTSLSLMAGLTAVIVLL